jgi:peptide deformylase
MALRPIKIFPDPTLRQPTQAVAEVDDATRTLVADMVETMYAKHGAGLASIQVGSLTKIFIVEASITGADPNDHPIVFINPTVEWLSDETEVADEGCLSFPGIYVPIKRALKARVRATGLDGKSFVAEGEGLYARAMQHENDHLNNKLLIDYVGPVKRQMIKRRLEKMTEEEVAELHGLGE